MSEPGRKKRLAIVIPMYNDWASFFSIVPALDRTLSETDVIASIIVVDDGSDVTHTEAPPDCPMLQNIATVDVLELVDNVGHQRAIAVGLTEAALAAQFDYVLVMDSDGEDRPEDVPRLLRAIESDPSVAFVVAQRAKRSENTRFRLFYSAYKVIFRILSGQTIDFGNFCVGKIRSVERIIHSPNAWNHFAAAVLRSRMRVMRIPTERGVRIDGKSSMNIVSLITLGLSAMSVYSDVVFVRTLLAAIACSLLAGSAFLAVVAIRLFSGLAIPGWASTVGGMLIIILFQALTVSAGAVFQVLGERSSVRLIPAFDASRFILHRHRLLAPERLS